MSGKALSVTAGLLTLVALAVVSVLWVLTTGASHTEPVVGVLEVIPEFVSPDDVNVPVGLRIIKITVTDPNLNQPLFVGTGPDGQTASVDHIDNTEPTVPAGFRDPVINLNLTDGNGETVTIPAGQGAASVLMVFLKSNPLGPDRSTPIADRNDNGTIDLNDIEIVNSDVDGNGTDGDVALNSIFGGDPTAGIVLVNILRAGLGGLTFDLRYATSGQELTRDTATFTESLSVLAPGTIVSGESVTLTLNNTLLDNDGDDILTTEDVNESSGAPVIVDPLFGDFTNIMLTATAVIASPTAFSLDYRGSEVLTLIAAPNARGDFTVALNNVILTAAGAASRNPADVVVTGDATVLAIAADSMTVAFNSSTLVNGDLFAVAYNNRQTFAAVSDPGVFDGEAFALDLNLDWLPLQDTNGDGVLSTADITVSVAQTTASNLPQITSIRTIGDTAESPSPNGLAASNTIDLVGSGDHLAAGTEIQVTYQGLVDLVTVRGDFTPIDGIPLRMLETGPDTGIFEGFVIAVGGTDDSANANLNPLLTGEGLSPHLAVQDGGAISVLYGDRSPARPIETIVQVEAKGPTFLSLSPAFGGITNDLGVVLTAQVSDELAGVNPSTVNANDPDAATSIALRITIDGIDQGTEIDPGDIDVTETFAGSGVFRIEYPLDELSTIADEIAANAEVEHNITWEVRVKDNAGNQGTTDVVPLKLSNRRPVLDNVFIGDNWDPAVVDDPTTAIDERLRGDRPGLPGRASRTSIRLVFDIRMDGASFQASDFLIDGVVPLAVDHFADLPDSVFLTVPELDPAATPKVEIVGEVLDAGGNALDIADPTVAIIEDATDGIAPKLTASFERNYTKGDIQFTVESDEAIAESFPVTAITRCGGSPLATCDTGDAGLVPIRRVDVARIEWTFNLTGVGLGLYNILLNAQDSDGNIGAAGNADATAGDALTFEIDKGLPASTGTSPTDDPVGDHPVGFTNPFFIEIDWSSEGTEYDGDTHGAVTLTKALLDAGTANERDVLPNASSRDGGLLAIAIPDIDLGVHTLTYNGQDGLGHPLPRDFVITFTVVSPSVIGTVFLEGRDNHSAAAVILVGADEVSYSATSLADGSYAASPPSGVYTVTVEREGFLTARRESISVEEGGVVELPPVTLLGGDIDANGIIDIKDIVIPAKNLGKDASPWR